METRTPIIALVDDDHIFQLTASRTLKSTNIQHKILQFENGEEALNFIRDNVNHSENLPDYIFLDINMPYVDGWMFLEDYSTLKRQFDKPISIFVVSSSIDPRDMSRAQNDSNVKEYVSKPVTKEKFIELLRKAA
jgi:CheY-like chemotaxis protein